MKAKEYLLQIRKAECLIRNKQNQIDELKSLLSYRGVNYGERVSGGKPLTDAELIAKIVDFESDINGEIDKLVDLKREIMSTVDKLDDTSLIDLIYKRYFNYMTWERIAVELDLCIRQVYRKHGEALVKIQKIINEVI